MARLPEPGADSGVWGDVLNDFLSTAHNPDGSLQDDIVTEANLAPAVVTKLNDTSGSGAIADGSITSAKLADGTIVETDLAPAVVTKLNAVGAGITRLTYSGSAYPARPAGLPAGRAEYVGPTQPTDWTSGDTWVDIS
jgi:hypothetical protein